MNAHCKYECPHCEKLHDMLTLAIYCCTPPEIWFCGNCGHRHSNENAADQCCRGKD